MGKLELARIRFVTRNFRRLQGLRIELPIGIYIQGLGLYGRLAHRHRVDLGLMALVVFAAAAWVVSRWGKAYYSSRFGTVLPAPVLAPVQVPAQAQELSIFSPGGAPSRIVQEGRRGGLQFMAVYAFMSFAFWAALRVDAVNLRCLTLLGFGTALATSWLLRRGPGLSQVHFLVAAALLCAAAVAVRCDATWQSAVVEGVGFQILTGGTLIGLGLGDHLELTRALGRTGAGAGGEEEP